MRNLIRKTKLSIFAFVSVSFLTFLFGLTSVEALTAPTSGKYMYFGTLWVTALDKTANCSTLGYAVGYRYQARLKPPSLGINGTNWNFSIFDPFGAESYRFSTTPTATLSTASTAYSIFGGGNAFTILPQFSITSQTPTSITTSTSYVYIEGKIRNIGDNASYAMSSSNYDGCDITFRFSGVLKP